MFRVWLRATVLALVREERPAGPNAGGLIPHLLPCGEGWRLGLGFGSGGTSGEGGLHQYLLLVELVEGRHLRLVAEPEAIHVTLSIPGGFGHAAGRALAGAPGRTKVLATASRPQ